MSDRATRLLIDIQKGVLDSSTSVSDLLRKCVALGGASGSRQLVDWASSELSGYEGKSDLPAYRTVRAPLQIDGISGWTQFKRKHIPPSALPEFARDSIKEEAQFVQGVGTLEAFVSQSEDDAVLIAPPASSELVRYWNEEVNSDTQEIHRLYWSVSKSEVAGILHQIRNRLVKLIAEFEIEYETAGSTAEAVDRAVKITMGDRGSVAVVSSDRGSTSKAEISMAASPLDTPKWTLGRKIWAAAVGSAGIAGAIFAYLALPR
jgi:hypothetical protein